LRSETLKEKELCGDPGMCGRMLFKRLQRNRTECVNWTHLAKYKSQWQALVNRKINLGVPCNVRYFFEQMREY
jgi:hypothetical protein